jgi:hypothetical protein
MIAKNTENLTTNFGTNKESKVAVAWNNRP